MKHRKSVLEVKIRLDPVIGWGHEPEDHVAFLQNFLNSTVAHYKPEVKLIGTEKEKYFKSTPIGDKEGKDEMS